MVSIAHGARRKPACYRLLQQKRGVAVKAEGSSGEWMQPTLRSDNALLQPSGRLSVASSRCSLHIQREHFHGRFFRLREFFEKIFCLRTERLLVKTIWQIHIRQVYIGKPAHKKRTAFAVLKDCVHYILCALVLL